MCANEKETGVTVKLKGADTVKPGVNHPKKRTRQKRKEESKGRVE